MVLISKRVRLALGAGVTAYAVTTLVIALACSPFVATHLDFNHVHPKGAPPHVHAISTVFTVNPTVIVSTLGVLVHRVVYVRLVEYRPSLPDGHVTSAHARSPPAPSAPGA